MIPLLTFSRSILSPVVEILVGRRETTFHIHSDLLCQTSDYFRACLQGNFSEATKGEVKLSETRASTFQYFVKWLYTGDVAPFNNSLPLASIFTDMADVFALGNRLLCEGLRNRAVDMIQEVCSKELLNVGRIVYAAQAVETRSLLMQYLIQQLSFDMVEEGYGGLVNDDAWLTFIAMDARMTSDLMCK